MAERVRAAAAEHQIYPYGEDSLQRVATITVSLGAATLGPEESMESLVRRVDDALYKAKATDRNRVAASLYQAGVRILERGKSSLS